MGRRKPEDSAWPENPTDAAQALERLVDGVQDIHHDGGVVRLLAGQQGQRRRRAQADIGDGDLGGDQPLGQRLGALSSSLLDQRPLLAEQRLGLVEVARTGVAAMMRGKEQME